ncbi:unnamed protein product, partial [Rotaria sp. Silwood2]
MYSNIAKRRNSAMNPIILLQNDFNDGQTLDLAPFQVNIQALMTMGFNQVKVLEALLITKNAETSDLNPR